MSVRLTHLMTDGAFELPEDGDIAIFGARDVADLAALPKGRLKIICQVKPEFDTFVAAGFEVVEHAPTGVDVSVVFLPRAKKEARAMLGQAMKRSARVIVDGQKTDGIDSILREMRKRAACDAPYAKAHGKIFVATRRAGDDQFEDWRRGGEAQKTPDGFVTVAGVFSADGIDPGSRLLAGGLPADLKGRVADFGAGWGYLAREILRRESVRHLDLVEADNTALDCARVNIKDQRAVFHWADATTWRPEKPLDVVVMNPPFHEGRKGAPALGQRFIHNAAACLAPGGRLFMVANRHLPYEADLRAAFREVKEIGGDNRFKIFVASRPSRPRR